MPVKRQASNNNSNYSNNRQQSRRPQAQPQQRRSQPASNKRKGGFARQDLNMLDFGKVFVDDADHPAVFKGRLILGKKDRDGNALDLVYDGDGKGETGYTKEEAALLVAKALLSGNAINFYLYEKEDANGRVYYDGNARINIMGIELDSEDLEESYEEEEPQPVRKPARKAPAPKKVAKKKPEPIKYEIPDEDDEDMDEFTADDYGLETEDSDDEEIPAF